MLSKVPKLRPFKWFLQIQVIPFKIVPLGSYTALPVSLLFYYTLYMR